MDGGDPKNDISQAVSVTGRFSTLSLNGDEESSSRDWRTSKDPRQIARKYQTDLCKKAIDENIIVCLETGCGKTHIAVLLIYEMGHLIKKPQKNICVFLAPTVALVQQQAKVIQDSIDFNVGTYCGNSKLKSHRDWVNEMEKYEVLVMTPQILLHNLSHRFIMIELIALLIFDECHHAQLESNHPYAEIMKVFYKSDVITLPRVFGMTASPKLGKVMLLCYYISGGSINSLETLLHAKVYTVEDKEELEQFVASPKVKIYRYGPVINNSSCPHMICYRTKLEEIKHHCVSMLSMKTDEHSRLQSIKKSLRKLHSNLIFCMETIGLWGTLHASRILLKGDHSKRNELIEVEGNGGDESLSDRYLNQAASMFSCGCMKDGTEADLSSVEDLKEPFFSRKLFQLIGILSKFRLQPNMKCIIFVNRIVIARSLSYILQNLKFLSTWKCDFLVGVHSGLKSMSRKNMNIILEKFRSGELNLLVATKVGEEGLDIQTCCLVIRFDLPETVSSFIQSRGRARMPQSEYAFLVDSGNQKELNLINKFKKEENQMNKEIASRESSTTFVDFEERTYKVDSTGAIISSGSSISLLHHYCSKLPHDEYFKPKPEFYYYDDVEGTICNIFLPSNAPAHQIVSSPQSSIEAAKKDACLKACKELHELGALTDYLLPDHDDGNEGSVQDSSDSDSCDDEEDSRRELHEMLVPAALKESWTYLGNPVCLYSYFIKFIPRPEDRLYKKFGLFVKAPLPADAEQMKLDLRLARGRKVLTKLVPSGVANFDKDEAQNFQHVWLKVILDRADLIPEFVSLEKINLCNSSSSTYYLLLPVILHEHENTISVDWKLVRRCLSSPIFRNPEEAGEVSLHLNNHLQLANGPKSIDDVVNSLVYARCKDAFFFISDVLPEKNGYSTCKESTNHIEHYTKIFGIHLLYPNQPLLKAKQLFCLDNLLRKKGKSESREKEEHFIELPPEICQLKIVGFSKDIGSSLSLLPSLMHRLESLLVAIELKQRFCASFPEGAEVTSYRVLEALTTEKCNECFSLERLEVLGDAFLKFAVGRRLFLLHNTLDEGQLTRKRSNIVNNSNLFKLATMSKLQVYIRDQPFDPCHFFALGRPCPVICRKETETIIHSPHGSNVTNGASSDVRCNKSHHWLYKKTIADVVEALVGAFIVDSGFKAATSFLKWIGIRVDFEASQINNICSESAMFVSLTSQIDIASLEILLGYRFLHKGLLVQAFVHPSYNNHWGCYQRLEFLGDAVLDYLITSYLLSVYPKLKPGQITDLRSVSVNNNSFADIAVRRSFHKFIICNSSGLCESMDEYANFIKPDASEKGLAEGPKCPKALGDLVESCVGAILLDTGFDLNLIWKIMLSFLDPVMSFSNLQLNPIRELQELCQSCNLNLQFPTLKKDGTYLVESKVNKEDFCASASATNINRKAAKRMAAQRIFARLKAQGYKPKFISLEEVLKSSRRMEAKLIGYDETPADVIAPDSINMKLLEPSRNRYNLRVDHMEEVSTGIRTNSINSVRQPLSPSKAPVSQRTQPIENNNCNSDSPTTGGSHKGSAKSRLYETCATNCWKPPLFECWKEMGPCHLKEFTFKVVVEIEEASNMILECYGEPRAKKKDAAEHAAEGALWYLKHVGYLPEIR
ncbi:dicer-like protein 4 isoform X2 [Cornus florida]|uniref:dicer-like protein 4 isoform X2 n=1 Tax=Cornus florida TaxID=4283 RepID=UPI00289E2F61|nr:dicer-like protein 4 isoform X2 [Cornus florida]